MIRLTLAIGMMLFGLAVSAQPPETAQRLDANGDPLPDRAIARLGTVRFQPPGIVQAIALSPDGKALAAASYGEKENFQIDFFNPSTGKSIRKINSTGVGGDLTQFTPDGKYLAVISAGIKLIDPSTGKVEKSIDIPNISDSSIAFSPDGNWLALQP